jgi:hypothetical protein
MYHTGIVMDLTGMFHDPEVQTVYLTYYINGTLIDGS